MENNETPDTKHPELVAYLDGELSAAERADVETRLANDRVYRQELAELQKTWDLLDLLPAVEATEEFTQSTVEMVALSAATQIRSQQGGMNFLRLIIFAMIGLVPVAAFCYGYWRTNQQLNAGNRQFAEDLQIIQRFPIYRSVNADLSPEKSIQFLELLAKEQDLFISFGDDQRDELINDNFEKTLTVEDLDAGKIGQIRLDQIAEYKRSFDKLDSQKGNLRKFHQLLAEHPNYDQLVDALTQFHIWFRERIFLSSQEEIDLIKDATPEKRIELIRQLEVEFFEKSFKYLQLGGRTPAIQDYKNIKAFGREILASVRDEFMKRWLDYEFAQDPELTKIIDALIAAPTDHHFFALMMRSGRQLFGAEFINPFFDQERISPFINRLTPESKKILEGLDDRTKYFIVQIWILSTLGHIDNSELAKFEDKVLSGVQRSSLNKLNNYKQKREILKKAFFFTLESFMTENNRTLPDDLLELENWESFIEKPRPGGGRPIRRGGPQNMRPGKIAPRSGEKKK